MEPRSSLSPASVSRALAFELRGKWSLVQFSFWGLSAMISSGALSESRGAGGGTADGSSGLLGGVDILSLWPLLATLPVSSSRAGVDCQSQGG